jgi:hypothetical protein
MTFVRWRLLNRATVCLAGARAQGWASGQGAGAHAEAGAEGRRNIAKKVAAAGAAAVVADGIGGVGAHPVAVSFAFWINALHGEARHVLHDVPLCGWRRG